MYQSTSNTLFKIQCDFSPWFTLQIIAQSKYFQFALPSPSQHSWHKRGNQCWWAGLTEIRLQSDFSLWWVDEWIKIVWTTETQLFNWLPVYHKRLDLIYHWLFLITGCLITAGRWGGDIISPDFVCWLQRWLIWVTCYCHKIQIL